MGKKVGRQTFFLDSPVYIVGSSTIAGAKEKEGPIGKYLAHTVADDSLGEDSYEKAERLMMEETIFNAIKDANIDEKDVDLLVGGDLLNQLVTTNYTARSFDIPFVGVYGACSTFAESLGIGACMLEAGYGNYIACTTGSHFSTSERQFRFPLELGNQRQTYSQWTVTGMGCAVLSKTGGGPKIVGVCFGKVTDYGISDIANMGAAMAPAVAENLYNFFKETGTSPTDYDLIATGDLGKLGSDILKDLLYARGYTLGKNYIDCGHAIYGVDQKTFQGGSGAGCSATVFNSYIMQKMRDGTYKKVLFIATGALMSTTTNQQGDTIPTIAHTIILEA